MAGIEFALDFHRDFYSPGPGVAHKRGNPITTSGFKADTVIR